MMTRDPTLPMEVRFLLGVEFTDIKIFRYFSILLFYGLEDTMNPEMKTTITIPNEEHMALRKLALERSVTMSDLIVEAVTEKFLLNMKKPVAASTGLKSLEGVLTDQKSSMKDIRELKKIWELKREEHHS